MTMATVLIRAAALAIAALAFAACEDIPSETPDPEPAKPQPTCLSSHVEVDQRWVPMSPGGFFKDVETEVCDEWSDD